MHFYNGLGTAEQWIKEGKYALRCPDLSGLPSVRGQPGAAALFIPAYDRGNVQRRLCLLKSGNDWSVRSLRVKFIKIVGTSSLPPALVFQLAEVAAPKEVFRQALKRIGWLRPVPG